MLVLKVSSVLVFSLVLSLKWIKCYEVNDVPIIIIGAGAAGIAAATKLQAHNFTNIKILEAGNEIGGRIQSEQFGDAFIDLGAEYCHGEKGNIVYSLAKKFNILKSSYPQYSLLYSNGENLSYELEEKLFSLAHSIRHRKELNTSKDDSCYNLLSVGECLDLNFKKLLGNISDSSQSKIITHAHRWLRRYKSAPFSVFNLNDLSLICAYEECEGDQMLEWNGRGFITILHIMMENYPEYKRELPIERNMFFKTKVLNITGWNKGSKVNVVCDKRMSFYADHVIFTPSVGVLKADHTTLFNPPLPRDKIAAIKNTGFGGLVKVGLYFTEKWWPDGKIWGCIWTYDDDTELNHKKLSWLRFFTALTSAPNNPTVLIALFVGEGVPDIEKLSDTEVLRGISYLMDKCFVKFNASKPSQITRSSWSSNPNFRGTYSYESVQGVLSGFKTNQNILERPLMNEKNVPSVLFAGEATHSTMYSTVHGAIETGYREAERLIKFYNRKT